MSRGDTRAQLERLTSRADHVVEVSELGDRLQEDRPLRVKLGVDPTAREVTLGWAVPLRKLRQFQDDGHIAVLVVGDFTARIGDPSGKSETRPQLSKEEVEEHARSVFDQFMDILSEDNLEIRYNSEWLEPMTLADVLRLAARPTVAQILERDDFQHRYREKRPISMIEFLYPLAQGYDSVAVQADVELGGSDQLFNLLLARDIQRAYGQRPQITLTMPLLIGTDGALKMSQSMGNYIGIREEPAEMFGKLMSIPDDLLPQYATLAACLPADDAHEVSHAHVEGGPEAARAKRKVARATVALYHGREAATEAEAAFDRQFRDRQAPESVHEVEIPPGAIDGDMVYLPRLLAELDMAASRGEARRLIAGGGVRINGEATSLEEHHVHDLRGAILQVGRRRFIRLTDRLE